MRVLLALGGNAMTSPDGRATPEDQIAAIAVAMESTARLIEAGQGMCGFELLGARLAGLLLQEVPAPRFA